MARLQITCIRKVDRNNPFESITAVGGIHLGLSWEHTQPQAIASINNGTNSYFVRVGGVDVNVIVARSRFGNEYIKTEADGENPNNLLALPQCSPPFRL